MAVSNGSLGSGNSTFQNISELLRAQQVVPVIDVITIGNNNGKISKFVIIEEFAGRNSFYKVLNFGRPRDLYPGYRIVWNNDYSTPEILDARGQHVTYW